MTRSLRTLALLALPLLLSLFAAPSAQAQFFGGARRGGPFGGFFRRSFQRRAQPAYNTNQASYPGAQAAAYGSRPGQALTNATAGQTSYAAALNETGARQTCPNCPPGQICPWCTNNAQKLDGEGSPGGCPNCQPGKPCPWCAENGQGCPYCKNGGSCPYCQSGQPCPWCGPTPQAQPVGGQEPVGLGNGQPISGGLLGQDALV